MFSEPAMLADFLRAKMSAVCSQWNELNSSSEAMGKRKPVGANYCLAEYRWHPSRNGRQQEERSRYNLEISSYAFSFQHMQDETVSIEPQNLKVCHGRARPPSHRGGGGGYRSILTTNALSADSH